jgi:thiamine kinase-like enzyme
MSSISSLAAQIPESCAVDVVIPFDKRILKELPIACIESVAKISSFSNENFLLNKKYVLRIPTPNSSQLSDRQQEYANLQGVCAAGICPLNILYYNCSTGVMLSAFLEDYHFLDFADLADKTTLLKAVETLQKLHSSDVSFTSIYDPRDLFFYYKRLLDANNPYYRDIQPTIEKLSQDLLQFKCNPRHFKPCHNDPNPSNFTLDKDYHCQMIDWEYSGLCDPAWDVTFLSEMLLLADTEPVFQAYGSVSQDFHLRCAFFKPLVHARSVLFACEQLQSEHPKLPKELLLEIYKTRAEALVKTYESPLFQQAKKGKS